jgi:hypothetical protein
MCQKYTNSWTAWRIDFYNSYIAQISTEKPISEKLGFRIDIQIQTVFLQFLSGDDVVFGANGRHFSIM